MMPDLKKCCHNRIQRLFKIIPHEGFVLSYKAKVLLEDSVKVRVIRCL